jgi:hypothetical protein
VFEQWTLNFCWGEEPACIAGYAAAFARLWAYNYDGSNCLQILTTPVKPSKWPLFKVCLFLPRLIGLRSAWTFHISTLEVSSNLTIVIIYMKLEIQFRRMFNTPSAYSYCNYFSYKLLSGWGDISKRLACKWVCSEVNFLGSIQDFKVTFIFLNLFCWWFLYLIQPNYFSCYIQAW